MKAPSKGSGYDLEGYGTVTVKSGPSPARPYVTIEIRDGDERTYESLHIDDFNDRRLR